MLYYFGYFGKTNSVFSEVFNKSIGLGEILFFIAVAVVTIVGLWKLFEKAGEPGWTSLIPFVNTYKLYKMAFGSGWWFLLLFIPIADIVIYIMLAVRLARSFGRGGLFALGLVLFQTIFLLILGVNDDRYIGPNGQAA